MTLSLFGKDGRSHRPSDDDLSRERQHMVEEQIERRGIKDERVLDSMKKVARHLFVTKDQWGSAYGDHPLPIGGEQTISQPYIVALMTEALDLKGGERVLEVGTGSGYQTAILAEVAGEVFSLEILPELSERAASVLRQLGYTNVHLKVGDGRQGWPDNAPYDGILVTAAPRDVPDALLAQLKEGGRLVIPVGSVNQELEVHTRHRDGFSVERLVSVRFVPLR